MEYLFLSILTPPQPSGLGHKRRPFMWTVKASSFELATEEFHNVVVSRSHDHQDYSTIVLILKYQGGKYQAVYINPAMEWSASEREKLWIQNRNQIRKSYDSP